MNMHSGSGERQIAQSAMVQECQKCKRLTTEVAELKEELDCLPIEQNEWLRAGIEAVSNLINESHGVAGLHLNDEVAPWADLQAGGQFEEWLKDFNEAADAAKGKT